MLHRNFNSLSQLKKKPIPCCWISWGYNKGRKTYKCAWSFDLLTSAIIFSIHCLSLPIHYVCKGFHILWSFLNLWVFFALSFSHYLLVFLRLLIVLFLVAFIYFRGFLWISFIIILILFLPRRLISSLYIDLALSYIFHCL